MENSDQDHDSRRPDRPEPRRRRRQRAELRPRDAAGLASYDPVITPLTSLVGATRAITAAANSHHKDCIEAGSFPAFCCWAAGRAPWRRASDPGRQTGAPRSEAGASVGRNCPATGRCSIGPAPDRRAASRARQRFTRSLFLLPSPSPQAAVRSWRPCLGSPPSSGRGAASRVRSFSCASFPPY
jgi:hypothetical protein